MSFRAWLDGEQLDLQRLAALFAQGDVRVVRDDVSGRYYLTATELDAAHRDDRVVAAVEDVLTRVNGAARLDTPDFQPPTYAHRYTTAKGDQVIQPAAAMFVARAGFSNTAVVRDSNGKLVPQPVPAAVNRVALAASNDRVRKVLGLLAGDRSWYDLWKVYETIRDAVGGQAALVQRLQWVTATDNTAFRESANNFRVSGDGARHAVPASNYQGPTMTLTEGQAFVSALVERWLASLGA